MEGHHVLFTAHTYRLLAEEETAELGVCAWVWEPEHASRSLGLSLALIGRSTSDWRLLIACCGCSQLMETKITHSDEKRK